MNFDVSFNPSHAFNLFNYNVQNFIPEFRTRKPRPKLAYLHRMGIKDQPWFVMAIPIASEDVSTHMTYRTKRVEMSAAWIKSEVELYNIDTGKESAYRRSEGRH